MNISPRATIKLDIQKTFDTIQWDAIVRILGYMGFPIPFISWIYGCITSVNYSIVINGSVVGFFKGKQGIRQGDPLSAYLFIVVMELLTQMLNKLVGLKLFHLHPKCKNPQIVSLLFVDDLIILCKPDPLTISNILKCLNEFYLITELKINLDKSEFATAGLSTQQLSVIKLSTGLNCNNGSITYLSLPLVTSRISLRQCLPLYDKIIGKLDSWANRYLSQAGRLTILKTIIFSMQVYWSRTFVLPIKLIKMIRFAMMRFFWKGNTTSKFLAPIAYTCMEKPVNKGGLGLLDIVAWNKAAHSQHLDDFLSNKKSLWVEWSRKHIIKENF